MDPAHDTPATHEGEAAQEGDSTPTREDRWSFSTSSNAATGSADSPRVSLFSPSVPPILPATPLAPSASSRPQANNGFASSPPSWSMPSFGAIANMERTARLKAASSQPPIVQLNTQVTAAQKSGDDPTTPLENTSRKRTTMDLGRHEQSTMTSLSKLFSETDLNSHSRAPSYNNATGPLYLRASTEAISLPDHLYTRGLLEGRHSDITLIAFGQRYNLHRLILDRAPFFTTALSEPWLESQNKDVPLHPEQIDPSITREAFELAIRKLYGVDISQEFDAEAIGLFATGCWLEMQDLIDLAIESILRQMAPDNLAFFIRLVTANYYGKSGDRILESAKAMLSRNGWEMALRYWDDMPGDIVRELVGSDGFFVDSEWDRWVLSKRLLDRRLRQAAVEAGMMQRGQKPVPQAPKSLRLMAVRFDGVYRQNALTTQASSDVQGEWLALYTTPDIERILVLLDEGIHYIHMDYEQLEFIRTARDVFGLPVMPDRVISNALWQQLGLRQRVLSTEESSQELGLCQTPPEPETNAAEGAGKGKQVAITEQPESESWDGNGKPRKFWIPVSDCNIVLGNGADPVVTPSTSFQRHATRLSASIQPEDAEWATDFASTPTTLTNPQSLRPISAGGGNAGQPKPISYSEYPPFRFSVEFPNPRFLKEKKRVYSRTVSYAGSLWNIYIQKVRSAKNVQLGVYLHRAKDREIDEGAQQGNVSADDRIGQPEPEMLMSRRLRPSARDMAAEDDTSGSGGDPDMIQPNAGSMNPLFESNSLSRRRSAANTPRIATQFPFTTSSPIDAESPRFPPTMYTPSEASSPTTSDDDDDDDDVYPNPSLHRNKRRSTQPALPAYVDARPTIRTYFKIYSPSKGGRMLSIYESAPDRFNFSQSWGWKSSTLMLDEGSVGGEGKEAVRGEGVGLRGEGKLRFMVVIGNL